MLTTFVHLCACVNVEVNMCGFTNEPFVSDKFGVFLLKIWEGKSQTHKVQLWLEDQVWNCAHRLELEVTFFFCKQGYWVLSGNGEMRTGSSLHFERTNMGSNHDESTNLI